MVGCVSQKVKDRFVGFLVSGNARLLEGASMLGLALRRDLVRAKDLSNQQKNCRALRRCAWPSP